MSKDQPRFTQPSDESVPPPYNRELDPDNATSPLRFEEREKEGERKFYPEGDPENGFVGSGEERERSEEQGPKKRGREGGRGQD